MSERRIFSASSPREPAAGAWLILLGVIALLTLWRVWVIQHSGISLYVDEAYYWTWAHALDWGYFSKPPMVAAVIAATTQLFGDGLVGVKAGSLILYPATAMLLFGLGRRLYDNRTGLLAAIAFLTLPITSALGIFISTDALLLFFWTASLWLLQRAMTRDRVGDWLLLGLTCGLGLMSKYTMAAFALTPALLLLSSPEGRRMLVRPGPWLCALVALVVLAPNLWWNWANDFPTFRHTAEITQERERSNLLEFIGAQIGSIGPLLALGLGGALLQLRSAWREPADRLLIAGTLPLLCLVIVQASIHEANANWAGPIFTAGTLLATAWLCRTQARRRWLAAGLALNLAITVLVYQWPQILSLVGRPLTAKIDPLKRMKGWDSLAAGVAPWVAQHPDAYLVNDERTLLAQMAYGLRDLHPRIASWNPDHAVRDQYNLTHSLPNTPGIDILYISSDGSAPSSRFTSAQKLGEVSVATHPDAALHATVWLLKGFKGY
ncbi:glycosyltransferase family 39 protein [Niveibacterium umoris]|uniref:Glycosyltransferase RgtA/B/C/D-like domain-containing protein n=1 Tax=Niveibacterium umoris TaxID=1193620 RepID=A0A840BLQ1_9RHOO|nr:glycosyltransferase family 39 protein [Niveibacterium umoris]MBB4011816.1 hypothetical protein [Niveibacterium umoris]